MADHLFERAIPLLYDDLQEMINRDPELEKYLTGGCGISYSNNEYAKQLVYASCLFDPGDLNKQLARFYFEKGSNNPVLNERRIHRAVSWLSAASKLPKEKRFPRAAYAILMEEVLELSKVNWGDFSRFKDEKNWPVTHYQTLDSTENLIRLMTEVTAMLGEGAVAERKSTTFTDKDGTKTKKIGYADHYVDGILHSLRYADWMNPDQKMKIFQLAWSLVPVSQRKDLLEWVKDDADVLREQIGKEKWDAILNTPSLVVHPDSLPEMTSAPPRPVSKRPALRQFIVNAETRVGDPDFKNRFPFSNDISREFEKRKFTFDSIRKINPHQVVVGGDVEGFNRLTDDQIFRLVFDSSNPLPIFKWAVYGKQSGPKREPLRYGVVQQLPEIFKIDRKTQWSSDGEWAIRWARSEGSNKGSVENRSLYRLIQIAPDGREIADLSPSDLNLIKNTNDRTILVNDRQVVLLEDHEEHCDINFCEIAKKNWQSQTIPAPEWRSDSILRIECSELQRVDFHFPRKLCVRY